MWPVWQGGFSPHKGLLSSPRSRSIPSRGNGSLQGLQAGAQAYCGLAQCPQLGTDSMAAWPSAVIGRVGSGSQSISSSFLISAEGLVLELRAS